MSLIEKRFLRYSFFNHEEHQEFNLFIIIPKITVEPKK